jgi:diguanylate cyclase (GGDEF)-like protein/putative nucleotidyltransferase with HDIG domain
MPYPTRVAGRFNIQQGLNRPRLTRLIPWPDFNTLTKFLNQKTYVTAVVILGCLTLVAAVPQWAPQDVLRLIVFLLIAAIGSAMKVTLPGVRGTMSVVFLFVLIGIVELSLPEVMLVGIVSVVVQCVWHTKSHPRLIQVLFNVAAMCVAITTSEAVYYSSFLRAIGMGPVLLMAAAASTQFVANAFPVACIIALSERKSLGKIWKECYFWTFPYYLVGAALAGAFSAVSHRLGWQVAIIGFPAAYIIYRSYRLYLGRLEHEKRHSEEIAGLHLRTIEALALAIDAKDATTHEHLRRVQTYAVEIGKELGLNEAELNALRAAAVLHDIGKLAVPEHIISKPGRLTLEEFEKMKIHPVVGAEILEQVEFPYPVVPIVRAHHEKWDGSGYPSGLKGEQIPIGARILAAVDCLDALASDRQYRRALPLDEAMAFVAGEANRSFDPKVIEILQRRYQKLERMSRAVPWSRTKLSTGLKVQNGLEPDAGFEKSSPQEKDVDFLSSIAAATHEAQALFELSQTLGNSLSLNETLSVFAMRLKRIVPHDAIAIYLARDENLVPEYVNGDDFRLFSSLRIPVGQGLSGWVAHNSKPILNGNPSVEPGYLNDAAKFSTLRSALAVPLEGVNGTIGVLTLYHGGKDAFSKDHLRVVLALTSKVALSIENAVKYQQAESSATTDFLTGLPNARSLFLHLDAEISRCKRGSGRLAVIVCDLDGFKQVNDRFGHLTGNRVLQMVAAGLRDCSREYDFVARMGGDEFVLVVPELRPETIQVKIQQISEMVRAIGREVCRDDLLDLSLGEAYYAADGLQAEDLLAEADRRMYVMKQRDKAPQIARLGLALRGPGERMRSEETEARALAN